MDEGLRRLLTCHDPRLDQAIIAEKLRVSRDTVKRLVHRLRRAFRAGRLLAVHLRRLESLGLHGVLVELRRDLAKGLASVAKRYRGSPVPSAALEGLVPEPGLLGAVFILDDGRVYATYRALGGRSPVCGAEEGVVDVVEHRFQSVPVRACVPPEEAEEEFQRLLSLTLPSKRLLEDLLVIGILDLNPLARLNREDFNPTDLLTAAAGAAPLDEAEARRLAKRLQARYRLLSLYGAAGRVYYTRPSSFMRAKALILAPADAAPLLYRAAVETLGAAYVAAGETVSLATASADNREMRERARSLGAEIRQIQYHFVTPPPIAYVDCTRNTWSPTPNPPWRVEQCVRAAAGAT